MNDWNLNVSKVDKVPHRLFQITQNQGYWDQILRTRLCLIAQKPKTFSKQNWKPCIRIQLNYRPQVASLWPGMKGWGKHHFFVVCNITNTVDKSSKNQETTLILQDLQIWVFLSKKWPQNHKESLTNLRINYYPSVGSKQTYFKNNYLVQ